MALRAVIFDFGMVLTGIPDQQAHHAMVQLTGLTPERFEELYWADRHAYDEGKLTGITFWQKFGQDSGLNLSQVDLDQLNQLDVRMWTSQDPVMVAWHRQLKERGFKTAVLSNMGDSVRENIDREFQWLRDFDVLVWSYELGIAKPDPAIYRHTLERLNVAPEEALFLDDKLVNVEAAQALGMNALVFTTPAKLVEQLRANGWDAELPLPQIV